jgi:hypothetical protein
MKHGVADRAENVTRTVLFLMPSVSSSKRPTHTYANKLDVLLVKYSSNKIGCKPFQRKETLGVGNKMSMKICKEWINSGLTCGESRQQQFLSLQKKFFLLITRRQGDVKLTQKFLIETEKNNQFLETLG